MSSVISASRRWDGRISLSSAVYAESCRMLLGRSGFSSARIEGLVSGLSTLLLPGLDVRGVNAVALLISSTSIGRTYFPSLCV